MQEDAAASLCLVFPNLAITVAEVGKEWPYAQAEAKNGPERKKGAQRRAHRPRQALAASLLRATAARLASVVPCGRASCL